MHKNGKAIFDKALSTALNAGIKAEIKLIEIDTLGRRILEVIAEQAQVWPGDVIVIGTHGRRGISHLFLGSVAENVVRDQTGIVDSRYENTPYEPCPYALALSGYPSPIPPLKIICT